MKPRASRGIRMQKVARRKAEEALQKAQREKKARIEAILNKPLITVGGGK